MPTCQSGSAWLRTNESDHGFVDHGPQKRKDHDPMVISQSRWKKQTLSFRSQIHEWAMAGKLPEGIMLLWNLQLGSFASVESQEFLKTSTIHFCRVWWTEVQTSRKIMFWFLGRTSWAFFPERSIQFHGSPLIQIQTALGAGFVFSGHDSDRPGGAHRHWCAEYVTDTIWHDQPWRMSQCQDQHHQIFHLLLSPLLFFFNRLILFSCDRLCVFVTYQCHCYLFFRNADLMDGFFLWNLPEALQQKQQTHRWHRWNDMSVWDGTRRGGL